MVKKLLNKQHWRYRLKSAKNRWKKFRWPSLKRVEKTMGNFVGIILKFATLLLLTVLIVFMLRTFHDQRFVIKSFSVPTHLAEHGYTGDVCALQLLGAVTALKEEANSVKEDSLLIAGDDQPSIDLAVMGIGLSLQSITYHLRELFGRENQLIRGEITQLDSIYTLTLRVTGFPPERRQVNMIPGAEEATIQQLFKAGAEAIIGNTDPYRMAVVCYHEDRYRDGIQYVHKILEERPNEAHWAYLAWGGILERQGKISAAISKMQQAIDIKPDFELAWVRIGWLLEKENRIEEATEALERAVELNPSDEDRVINLAWYLHRQDQYDKSEAMFKRAIQLNPENANLWTHWANSRLNQRDITGADSIFRVSSHLLTNDVSSLMSRGTFKFLQGDTLAALDYYQSALQLDPAHRGVVQALANISYTSGRYQAVVDLYQEIDWTERGKFTQQTFANYAAMSYNMLGEHNEAMQTVRASIALEPSIGYPYSTLAETFAFQGQLDSFYHYLEVAFAKGMNVAALEPPAPPYTALWDEPRLQQLMAKYRK